jgi:CDP-glycerol glycerophosphotransferase (TagB/SpsB family)
VSRAHDVGSHSGDPREAFLRATGWFDASWYVSRFPQDASAQRDPLGHFLTRGSRENVAPHPTLHELSTRRRLPDLPREEAAPEHDDWLLTHEIELIRKSGLFDADYYLDNNPDVEASGVDPLQDFCAVGWRALRRPSPDFDVWWYWTHYLDPARDAINPLLHYVLYGRDSGFAPAPPKTPLRPARAYEPGQVVRRVCLFAGFDRDGLVDDSVVAYVRELSRFADVFYLADCAMEPGELDKLAGVTKGAWAVRHGAYDFGSYSMLAKDLVGWEVIDSYDELILANDSCYLLRPLDEVFAKMDAKACDWWGMQATKGIFKTRHVASNQFSHKIEMERVKTELLQRYEHDYLYDFHVGSYFLVYRSPVIADELFRRQLDAVHSDQPKLAVVQKYEIGLTHYLAASGFGFDTFVDFLYPFHPLFTSSAFDLIAEGFPLLKKYFLYQNNYETPDLVRWKERVLELVPDAPVEMLERNLLRVAPDDGLRRSFSIVTAEDGSVVAPRLLSSQEFAEEDRWAPKFDHWWAFPVCAYDHSFAGNERAVFEEVRSDPSVKKIVLTRSRRVEVDGPNVVVVPLVSPEGQYYLLRARQIFVKHGPRINARYPLSPRRHNVINLWHGVPLKRFGAAALEAKPRRRRAVEENRPARAVVTSSRVDSLAMVAAFYPLTYEDMWATGLPRNDFVLCAEDRLPADLREQESRLRELVGDRRLVLFMPTFKDGQADSYYEFSETELAWLRAWCERENVVLGVRGHMADTAQTYSQLVTAVGALNLSSRRFPDVEVLYRVGSALVTDYSSCLIDFLLTGRPVVSFAYDHDRYAYSERGLFYDLEQVLPGPVCRDFHSFSTALDHLFDPPDLEQREVYTWKRSLFFDHVDDQNAWRLVRRVRMLSQSGQTNGPAAVGRG